MDSGEYILPILKIKYLASKVLAKSLRRLSRDWQKAYGHQVYLTETFVDSSRFEGTCYKAANWQYVGQTPIIHETKERFDTLTSSSFDKDFHSPSNQKELSLILDKVILPRKGQLSAINKEIENSE